MLNFKTPWEELSKYQSVSENANLSGAATGIKNQTGDSSVLSFDPTPKPTTGVVSDKVKKAARVYSEGLSLSQVVGSSAGGELLSNDPRELRAEVSRLRRQVAKIEEARFIPLHPKETVQNIFLGKNFSLEFYKSFQDKVDLIDEAIALYDGDAILVVTLFLRKTLNPNKLLEILSTRPVVVKHLSNYLETRNKLGDLSDLLTSLGQHEKAALIQYKAACRVTNLETRTKRLKQLLSNHFHGHPDANLLVEHIHLLERISPVIEADKRRPEISSDPLFPSLNPQNETVFNTLLYCCYHHYNLGENLLQSPQALKKTHSLSDQQFTWLAFSARAKRKQWKECEALTLTKTWLGLGGKKTKSSVDPVAVVKTLKACDAPADVLLIFLQLIEDLDEREDQARRAQVHHCVIDCLVAKRDRFGLESYRSKLTPQSQDWFYADHALNTTNTKWKN